MATVRGPIRAGGKLSSAQFCGVGGEGVAQKMENVVPTVVDKEAVRTLMEAEAKLVEVLSQEQYEKIHLAGAINIPLATIDRTTVEELNRDEPVIVYCHDFQ